MDRWTGILKVPLHPNSRFFYRVGVSLRLSPNSKAFTVPSANAIFFNGDRVEGTGNPVIERLSDLNKIAEILVSKFGSSVNVWVIEAALHNGPFAVYKDFIPCVNRYGEPKFYDPVGFPASASTVSLLSHCLNEAKKALPGRVKGPLSSNVSTASSYQPKTCILGFSKGGTVLNQLVSELAFSEQKSSAEEKPVCGEVSEVQEEGQIIPSSKQVLLDSITEIHYIDVGLNSSGAYITDTDVIKRVSDRIKQRAAVVRFVLHGTPRQWHDDQRGWIRDEKDKLFRLLESEAQRSDGKLQVREKFYYADRPPDMQMHFEVIESMDIS